MAGKIVNSVLDILNVRSLPGDQVKMPRRQLSRKNWNKKEGPRLGSQT